jgi:PadR family transcriptional regulator, regulatory protein PadR
MFLQTKRPTSRSRCHQAIVTLRGAIKPISASKWPAGGFFVLARRVVSCELHPNRRRILLALYVFFHASGPRSLMRDTLGEFEQMVLLAILHLGEDVYGVPIVDEIARRTGREVAPAAVYVTLRRLEEKGMLASWMGESTGERGGKARRYVRVTRAGLESLRASRKALDSMWRGLDIDVRGAR